MTEQQPSTALVSRRVTPDEWAMLKEQSAALEAAGKGSRILPNGITNRYQISAIGQKGAELGFPIMYALENIAIVEGKPAVSSQAYANILMRAHGPRAYRIIETTDERCTVRFHRADDEDADGDLEITWTLEDAKRAGLAGKDNWRKYPRTMLRWRAISEGAKVHFPDAIAGVYLAEELAVPMMATGEGDLVIVHEAATPPESPSPALEADAIDAELVPEAEEIVEEIPAEPTQDEIDATMAANDAAAAHAERIKQAGNDAMRDASQPPGNPASQNQLHTIAKYRRLLGQDPAVDEGMTMAEARDLIVKITGEYARLHGTPGSENGTSNNEEPTAPAANGLQPLVEELATLKGLSPDEVHRDIEQRCNIESLYLAAGAMHDRAEKMLRGDIAKKQRDRERQAARAGR